MSEMKIFHGRPAELRAAAKSIETVLERLRFAEGLILNGFTYDPGHSDLDDEQPITVRMTLGDYRKVRNMR